MTAPEKSWKAVLLVFWYHQVEHSYEVLFVFLPSLVVEKYRVMSKNVNFHYIKSTFFDITLNFSTTNDGKKTNNTSFECLSKRVKKTRRTVLQLSQGLSCYLFFKKCSFYKKGCMIVPNKATWLFLRYFGTNI